MKYSARCGSVDYLSTKCRNLTRIITLNKKRHIVKLYFFVYSLNNFDFTCSEFEICEVFWVLFEVVHNLLLFLICRKRLRASFPNCSCFMSMVYGRHLWSLDCCLDVLWRFICQPVWLMDRQSTLLRSFYTNRT